MESNRLQFFIPMKKIPSKTYQMKRLGVTKSGRAYVYEDDELKAIRMRFEAELSRYIPNEKFKGPIQLVVKWCYQSSEKHGQGTWKTSKPDTDNLIKLLKDCMTLCGFWEDDAQVCREISEKFYNDVCGVFIAIEEME